MKKIAILGSTGSIGKSTLKVAKHLPDDLQVTALAAHSNIEALSEQIKEFRPEIVSVHNKDKAALLKKEFPKLKIVSGIEGLEEVAVYASIDLVVVATTGVTALYPTIRAIEAKKNIALANKEVLVAAGEFIVELAKKNQVRLLPVDSEHSAIFQCLDGKKMEEIHRVILTASGGPFRKRSFQSLQNVTPEEALAHPTWNMGPKVTLDSSTLMNKGLEMIEARWLFDIPKEKIEVVIHPQSVVHSFIEWIDGCMTAELSDPNMIYPIQYALCYPERKKGLFPPFDFIKNAHLEFYPPDFEKFPALSLAREALHAKGSYSCYLNAANEVLVERFLQKQIPWLEIMNRLEKLMSRHNAVSLNSLESVLEVDKVARQEALKI